jgi:diguanylate cyclase (GGDEF)-like protein
MFVMDLIAQWFKDNLDIVFFLYGLAFFVMGISILVQPRKESAFKLADILWLLAWFGLVHGINEWLDMWTIIKHQSTTLDLIRLFCLILSFIFLFEFGKRLLLQSISEDTSKWGRKITQYLSWGAYLVVGIIILSSISISSNLWQTGGIWARYLLAFPGALFTGLGFFAYYRHNEKALTQAKVKNYFLWSGSSFIIYGIASGLIVPKGDFFPSNWLNNDSFFSTLHIPVQVFRAVLAIIAALSVTEIIKIFDWESRKRIEDASITDELTGIHNRRGFLVIAEHQLKIADRTKIGIFILYADIDNFKWINDSFGHKEGDFALREFARILKNVYRKSDVVGRLGGDEFAVIPVGATGDSVEEITNRLQKSFDLYNTTSNRNYKLSASVGISHYDPKHPCSIDELIVQADKKMYEMKRHKPTL